jgi:large subunit ribosomal protein L15
LLKFNAEITLRTLEQLGADSVDILTLKQAGLVGELAKVVKVIKSGEIKRAVKLTGIGVTAGARVAIEAAGGSIAE